MIAKAKCITHGHSAIRYALDKEKANLIRMNLLGKALDASAVWSQMLIHQKRCEGMYGQRRSLVNNAIRIEISPARGDTEGWTMHDWENLVDDFIRAFDSIDLSAVTGDRRSKCTNLAHSQYVVALHRDSKSGIEHLHLIANRVDADGHVNDDHMIHRRAMQAAVMVNARRGWKQSESVREDNISRVCNDCLDVLRGMPRFSWARYCEELDRRGYEIRLKRDNSGQVRGYSIRMGNTTYKSSELGPGRHLMPSKIEDTWRQMHTVPNKVYDSDRDVVRHYGNDARIEQRLDVVYRLHIDSDIKDVRIPAEINSLITNEISSDNASVEAAQTDVVHIAVALFVGMVDAATDLSCSCGGGVTSPGSDWGRDPKDDDWEWARRCARMALLMSRPRRRGLRR